MGVEVADDEVVTNRTARVQHSIRSGRAGRHMTFTTAKTDAGWRWTTTTWLLDGEDEQLTVQIRLEVHATGDANTALDRPIAVPALVPALLNDLDIKIDGFRLGRPLDLGVGDVEGFVALLLDTERHLPVTVVTPTANGQMDVNGSEQIARKTGGLTHVFNADAEVTWKLSEHLGRQLSVFDGGVRIYWPGFTTNDRPNTHPLWTRRAIEAIGAPRFPTRMLRELAPASTLHDNTPRLVLALQAEQRAAERATSEKRLAELRAQLELAAAAGQGGLEEEFVEQIISEYDTTISTVTRQRDEALSEAQELRERVDQLHDDLEAQRRNWATLGYGPSVSDSGTGSTSEGEPEDVDEEATSIYDAVRIAAEMSEHLEFLSEAYTSAAESAFPRPDQVLTQLRALDRVARRLFESTESKSLRELCPEEGLSNFRSGISTTASGKYAADYQRSYKGATIVLDEHLATGIGAPSAIMRIYFTRDSNDKKIIVGHVGRKLRDKSNP